MDASKNDLRPEANPEIPSITMYPIVDARTPKAQQRLVSYQGPVRYNHILDWVAKHATVTNLIRHSSDVSIYFGHN